MKTSIQPDKEIVDAHLAWAIRLIGQVQLEEDCGEILDQLLAISELLTRTEDMAADMPGGIPASFLHAHRLCLEDLQQATNKLIGHPDGDALFTGPAPRLGWEQFYKL